MASRTSPPEPIGEPPAAPARETVATVDQRPPGSETARAALPTTADRIAPGDLIDNRYEVVSELGRGGMGRVLACHDRKLGREVALKLIRVTAEEDSLARFELEARSTAGLHHPNVVAVFDTGMHKQLPYISTELLLGQTLRQRLDKGRLGAHEAAGIAVQIARGLSAAHAHGVVHRDLKPENVFLCDDGQAKLLDFGIAKLLSPDGEAHRLETPIPGGSTPSPTPRTETGRILGTAGYLAPEQVRGHAIDRRADLFALGAVLYEMLVGQRVFKGATQVETMYAVMHSKPPPLPKVLPARLRNLIDRCLAKSPEGRPASADEVVQQLEPIAAQLPTSPINLARGWWSRREVRIAAGALALLMLIAAGFLFAKRHRSAAPPSERIVAVLPFTVRGAESASYLGDGMVDLLSMSLSGEGARAVDPHSLLGLLTTVQRPIDLPRAQEIAKRLGATEFIVGTVVESQGELRVQASLFSTEDPRIARAEAHAAGRAQTVFKIVDDLTAELNGLPILAGGAGESQAKLAKLTTGNSEALAAYLRGEALSRHGQDAGAAKEFAQAVKLDPGFALAQYRLAVVTTSEDPALSQAALAHALAPGTRLPARYQSLARAFLAYEEGRFDDADSGFRTYLRSHPEDVWAWFSLGETLFHLGPIHGRASQEAEQPFQQTLLLDPSQQGDPLGHLLDLAQLDNNRELITTWSTRFLAQAVEANFVTLPIRWINAWATGDTGAQKQILERLSDPSTTGRDLRVSCLRATFAQDADGCAALAEAASRSTDPLKQADAIRMQALVALMKGQPEAARAQLHRVPAIALTGQYALESLWAATLDFMPYPKETLLAALDEARAMPPSSDPLAAARLHYLMGILLVRTNQLDAAGAEISRLEALAPIEGSITRDLALGLRAQVLNARGQYEEALSALEKQELRIPLIQTFQVPRIAEMRLRASLYARKGHLERALALYDLIVFYNQWEPIYLVPAALDRARLFEQRGDREHAVEEYQRVVTAWSDCEPALRPALEDAKSHLAALRAEPSSPDASTKQ